MTGKDHEYAFNMTLEGYTKPGNVYDSLKVPSLKGKPPEEGETGEFYCERFDYIQVGIFKTNRYSVNYSTPDKGVILYDYDKLEYRTEDLLNDLFRVVSSGIFGLIGIPGTGSGTVVSPGMQMPAAG